MVLLPQGERGSPGSPGLPGQKGNPVRFNTAKIHLNTHLFYASCGSSVCRFPQGTPGLPGARGEIVRFTHNHMFAFMLPVFAL